jgi:hypothetical protein
MKAFSIVGFVCSVVGLVLSFVGLSATLNPIFNFLALVLAIVGLVFSAVSGKKLKAAGQASGLAKAGLIVGIIGVCFAAIFALSCGMCKVCTCVEAKKLGAKGWSDVADLIKSGAAKIK